MITAAGLPHVSPQYAAVPIFFSSRSVIVAALEDDPEAEHTVDNMIELEMFDVVNDVEMLFMQLPVTT